MPRKPILDRVPEGPAKLPYVELDRENAFMLYATFCGDVERTAHALNVRPLDVARIADEEGWAIKLSPIIALKKSSRPGDIERAINRAINFTQAHRLRLVLERLIAHWSKMSNDELLTIITSVKESKDGAKEFTTVNTRPVADLAAALEKCHTLTYQALNDTSAERARRQTQEDTSNSATEMALQVEKAMEQVGESGGTRAMLFDAQLEIAQSKTVVRDDTHEGEDG